MLEEVINHVKQLGKADQQPEMLKFYGRKGKSIDSSEIFGVETEYDKSDEILYELYYPITNNGFVLDPPPATTNTHGNDDIVDDNNNDTHNDNSIIIDNEHNPDNENIHDHDNGDPKLENTNEQLQPAPLPDPIVEYNNISRSVHVHSNPQRLIPSLDGRKYYYCTAATTIM